MKKIPINIHTFNCGVNKVFGIKSEKFEKSSSKNPFGMSQLLDLPKSELVASDVEDEKSFSNLDDDFFMDFSIIRDSFLEFLFMKDSASFCRAFSC